MRCRSKIATSNRSENHTSSRSINSDPTTQQGEKGFVKQKYRIVPLNSGFKTQSLMKYTIELSLDAPMRQMPIKKIFQTMLSADPISYWSNYTVQRRVSVLSKLDIVDLDVLDPLSLCTLRRLQPKKGDHANSQNSHPTNRISHLSPSPPVDTRKQQRTDSAP